MSINLRTEKQIVIYSCDRLQQGHPKEQTTDLGNNVDQSQEYYAEHKKLESNDSTDVQPKSRQH